MARIQSKEEADKRERARDNYAKRNDAGKLAATGAKNTTNGKPSSSSGSKPTANSSSAGRSGSSSTRREPTGREDQTPRASSRSRRAERRSSGNTDYHESRRREYNKTLRTRREEKKTEETRNAHARRAQDTDPFAVIDAVKDGTIDWTRVAQDSTAKTAHKNVLDEKRAEYKAHKKTVEEMENKYGKAPEATDEDIALAKDGDPSAIERVRDAKTYREAKGHVDAVLGTVVDPRAKGAEKSARA